MWLKEGKLECPFYNFNNKLTTQKKAQLKYFGRLKIFVVGLFATDYLWTNLWSSYYVMASLIELSKDKINSDVSFILNMAIPQAYIHRDRYILRKLIRLNSIRVQF